MRKSLGELTEEEQVMHLVRNSIRNEKMRNAILDAINSGKPWGISIDEKGYISIVSGQKIVNRDSDPSYYVTSKDPLRMFTYWEYKK